jgi:hypothetical protein
MIPTSKPTFAKVELLISDVQTIDDVRSWVKQIENHLSKFAVSNVAG